jgi:class 3 adenylate cyclase
VDHAFWAGDIEPVIAEIEEFLTGMRTAAAPDRLLATILFTDIVGSTERARELGDHGWHVLLDEHNARVRDLLERFGERIGDKLGGVAVHVGARIAAMASGGEVLVSRTVRDLVAGSGLEFTDRGTHRLRGIDEPWQVFAVRDAVLPQTRLTGPREHMSAVDRAFVQVARRAPAVLRLGARLAAGKP